MSQKKVTIRMHPILYDKLKEILLKTTDLLGYEHVSMNTWLNQAIKEKIERDNKVNG